MNIEKIRRLLELQLFCSWQPYDIQDIPQSGLNKSIEGKPMSHKNSARVKNIQRRMDDMLLPDVDRMSYNRLLLEIIRKLNVKVSEYELAMSWISEGLILELSKNTAISEDIIRLMVLKQTAMATNKEHIIAAALNYNRIAILPFRLLKELSKNQQEDLGTNCLSESVYEEMTSRVFRLIDFLDRPPNYPDTRSIDLMSYYCREDLKKWTDSQLMGKLILEAKMKIFDSAYNRLKRNSRPKRNLRSLDATLN